VEEVIACNSVLNWFPLVSQGLGELQRQEPEKGWRKAKVCPDIRCRGTFCVGFRAVVGSKDCSAAVPMVCEYFHASAVGGHLGVYKSISKIGEILLGRICINRYVIGC
jgi:hypothetical protein